MSIAGGVDMATPAGYYTGEMYSIVFPFAVMFVAAASGARAFGGEIENRTIGLVMSTPTRRTRLAVDKAVAMVVHVLLSVGLLSLGVWAGVALTGIDIGAGDILAIGLMLTLLSVAVGGLSAWDLLPPLLILAYWPLNEWLIHVFILHAKPFRLFGRTIDPAIPRKHRAHHRDPWDLELVFIPLQAFAYTLPAVAGLCFLATPTPQLALTALLTYLVLALRYEWVHYIAHTRYTPKSARAQALIRNHRLHHFKNEHYWYGVSMLAADRPLRTSPDPESVERSDTARTLGVAEAR